MSSKVANIAEQRIKRSVEREEPCVETVIHTLEQALNDLKSGTESANKVMIILLNDDGKHQATQVYLGALTAFQAIGLTLLAQDDLKEIARGEMYLD